MKELSYINFIIAVLFAVCFSYQAIYMAVSIFKKQKKFIAKDLHKFAIIIAARNEEHVISQLIESIRWQKYPSELIDIFVIADNCTDNTARVARDLGCTVYERQNKELVGKGYALDYLFSEIYANHTEENYDAFMIFDADNIADENYVSEMNKVFDNGYNVITSYRNSKNFDDNWISAAYSLWFLREARFLNNPRMALGNSCVVSGTGFLVSSKIIKENGGWKFFTLTEDFEFSFDRIQKDDIIGYAENAILYDEQPTSLSQSITQRSRWIKGFLQVMGKSGGNMMKKIVFDGSFSSYDMIMNSVPTYFLTLASVALNVAMFVVGVVTKQDMNILVYSCITTLLNAYLGLFFLGALTAVVERKRIKADRNKLIASLFLFPLFVATYLPAMMVALFTDVSWKPIKHKATALADTMKKSNEK